VLERAMTMPKIDSEQRPLEGRAALVTGATGGLGSRFARTLAAAGARVAITARRQDKLAELERQIAAEGGQAVPIPMDVADAHSIIEGARQAEERLGPIDLLVNNAGIPDAKYATNMPVQLIDSVINVNLRGPFILACEVARRLIAARRPGRIINIASMSAFHYPGGAAALYSVTKAGIVRMTEALAVEWARFHINVNAIAPGAFHSEMMDAALERVGDISAQMPRGRILDPALLDSTLLYLCSPASEAVTGTIIKVDDAQHPR
jgi:NAD(P)-dependent dehydrogenase (short-subunit alcohol dehydrogenase family)